MNSYTSIFRVGLLDDLHNYFPELLYNSSRFHTVQDVLQYIQDQARTQCNPFEQGQNAYNRYMNNTSRPQNTVVQPPLTQIPVQAPVQAPVQQDSSGSTVDTPIRIRTTAVLPPPAPRRRMPVSYYFTEDLISNRYDENIIGMNALTNLFNIALNPSSMVDVPVVPTNQQVDAATTLLSPTTPFSEPCAICQDIIEANTSSRRINRCHHTFHQPCIDRWFQSSVTCPICRTDIRGT